MRRVHRPMRAIARRNAGGSERGVSGVTGFCGFCGFSDFSGLDRVASIALSALLVGCAGSGRAPPPPPPAPAVIAPALESAPAVELAPGPAAPATATPGPALANAPATSDAKAAAAYSRSYGTRVAQAVRANIIYPATALPRVKKPCEVEVSTAPDGRIVGFGVTDSSGSRDWDDAVKRALMRTHMLPLDADGRVPARLVLHFSPR